MIKRDKLGGFTMSELKTLKNLKINEGCGKCRDKTKPYSSEQLKQEAIKWIKDLQKGFNYLNDPNETTQNYFAIIRWIKHFFNLTEEDLQ